MNNFDNFGHFRHFNQTKNTIEATENIITVITVITLIIVSVVIGFALYGINAVRENGLKTYIGRLWDGPTNSITSETSN